MWRARRALAASSKLAVMRARMASSGGEQAAHELDHVAPHLLAQRPAPHAAAEQALVGAAAEQEDEQHGVHREHEQPRLVVRERAASEPPDPRREGAPPRRQYGALDVILDLPL